MKRMKIATAALLAVATIGISAGAIGQNHTLLNVSYDPTRELYREFNDAFATWYRELTGRRVTINMSHGGSGSQARAVIDGLDADVVTLALAADVDAIVERGGRIPENWQEQLPHNSAPYQSTLAFLVRRGNPKNIQDWSDLTRSGVEVITPNPKTSGVARWNYLAMWGYALREELGEEFIAKLNDPAHATEVAAAHAKAQGFVAAIYRNVPVLDQAARAATNTFVQRRIGDVLINWENEILLGANEIDEAGLELVIPRTSIQAEPVVAVVEVNASRKGNLEVARAYLEFLYSDIGQDLAGKHYYRPANPEFLEKYAHQFPSLELFTIDEVFGGWAAANEAHFADGASFDRIYSPSRR